MPEFTRGTVWWMDFDPVAGREQGGRRPGLVVASNAYLNKADTLAIVLPATTVDRGWPNHITLSGPHLALDAPTFAMTEQPRTITRTRIFGYLGQVDVQTMAAVDTWLRDFLSL